MESKTPDPPNRLPVKLGLDRSAVERVLARAAELQSQTSLEQGEAISESQLLEIANEVGLTPHNIKQALAEEQTRLNVESDGTWITRVAGPPLASATRTIRGDPNSAMDRLNQWILREEGMQVQRSAPNRIIWEPQRDWFGVVRRNLNLSGRSYQLTRSRTVSGTAVPIDESSTLVRLDADTSASRSRHVGIGGVFGVSGVTLSGVLTALAAIMPTGLSLAFFGAAILPLPAAALGVYLTLKHQQDYVLRTKIALEHVLDQLERPPVFQPSLLDTLTGRHLLR